MKLKTTIFRILLMGLFITLMSCKGQQHASPTAEKTTTSDNSYEYKKGDYNGIGKWYLGREIAHVMGFQGMEWLERPEREKEENVTTLLENMNIQPDDVIADIGAGSGYHVFKMIKKLESVKYMLWTFSQKC